MSVLAAVDDLEGCASTEGLVLEAKSPPDFADSPANESDVTIPGFSTLRSLRALGS